MRAGYKIYEMWSRVCDCIVSPAFSWVGMLKEFMENMFVLHPSQSKNIVKQSVDLKSRPSTIFRSW